jgi:ribosomal protein L7/L12
MDRTGWTFEKSKSFCEKLIDKQAIFPQVLPEKERVKVSEIKQNTISEQELAVLVKKQLNSIGKLETVKFVMDKTGWGLKESKVFCDKIADEADLSECSQQPESRTVVPPLTIDELQLAKNAKEKIATEGKFEAVKYVMATTGWGLKESKSYCDQLESGLSTGDQLLISKISNGDSLGASKLKLASKTSSENTVLLDQDEVKSIIHVMGCTYEKAEEYCKNLKQYDEHIKNPYKLKS